MGGSFNCMHLGQASLVSRVFPHPGEAHVSGLATVAMLVVDSLVL